jgi:hypothetical protein
VPANLINLCRSHHVLVHEGGFHVEQTSGIVRFRRPDGKLVPTAPTAPTPENLVPMGNPHSLSPRNFTPRVDWDAIAASAPA